MVRDLFVFFHLRYLTAVRFMGELRLGPGPLIAVLHCSDNKMKLEIEQVGKVAGPALDHHCSWFLRAGASHPSRPLTWLRFIFDLRVRAG